MHILTRSLITGTILTASLAVAHAQTPSVDHTGHHPAGETEGLAQPPSPPALASTPMTPPGMPMMGGDMRPMMEMMRSMMAEAGMGRAGGPMRAPSFAHIEGQIAFYKAELRITEAQQPQWDVFAETLRSGAKTMQAPSTQTTQDADGNSAIAQMDRAIAVLSTTAGALTRAEAAGKPLYTVLSDEQKSAADQLMAEHLRGM